MRNWMNLNEARKLLGRPRGALLNETSLSRLHQHWKSTGFAIVSAWRQTDEDGSPRPPRVNKAHTKTLKRMVRAAGYGFVPLIGTWAEVGMPPLEELSLFIPDKRQVRESILGERAPVATALYTQLRELAIRWGAVKAWQQEGVIWGAAGGYTECINPVTREVDFRWKEFHPNKAGIAYSRIRGGGGKRGTFLFEWRFAPPPKSFAEAARRQSEGECAFVPLNF